MNFLDIFMRSLRDEGLPEDLHQIAEYLLNDVTVSRKEIKILERERQSIGKKKDEKSLVEISNLIERELIGSGASRKQAEDAMLAGDDDSQMEFVLYNINYHTERVQTCLALLEEIEDDKFDNCLGYFRGKLDYQEDFVKRFEKELPKFKVRPAEREWTEAHKRTLRSFIELLQTKKNTPISS